MGLGDNGDKSSKGTVLSGDCVVDGLGGGRSMVFRKA